MRRSLKYLGVVLIIVGTMLTVVPTGAFSTFAGERGVDVPVAGDNDAFVAVSGTNRVVATPSGTQAAAIVNNLESSVTVQYEASVDTSTLEVENPSDTVTIFEGGSEPITVACSPSKGGSGRATLQINIIEAQGDAATVTDATLETTVKYQCPTPSTSERGSDESGDTSDDESDDQDGNADDADDENDENDEDGGESTENGAHNGNGDNK